MRLLPSNRHQIACFAAAATLSLCVSGCFNPYYGYGGPYGQPMYPRNPANAAPGTLVIPEGSDMYAPGAESTYENDPPKDDFRPEGSFYGNGGDGGVPQPQDLTPRDGDLRGSQTYTPDFDGGVELAGMAGEQGSGIQQVSGELPSEYGYDYEHYSSLRGIVTFDQATGGWKMRYSLAGRDEYGGVLPLSLPNSLAAQLRSGDNVVVTGSLDAAASDSSGRPLYRVDTLEPLD